MDEPTCAVLALVGEKAAELALAQAEPGTEICRETGVPCSPLLSIKQNAAQLLILCDDEQAAWFRELIDAAGLNKQGWSKPFRKDQPGQLRLWGILTALLTLPDTVLALEPMAGMTSHDREAFGRLLALSSEKGIEFRYTAKQLQDVMRLDLPQRVRFAAGDSRDTDTAALAAELEASGTDMTWDELQKRQEAEKNG